MNSFQRPGRVFMMDLLSTVPYYTAYLSRALLAEGVDVQIGAITYYLDRHCFDGRKLKLDPGLLDVAGRLDLPRTARRLFKLLEGALNLLALALRFCWKPPAIVHIQFLPLLRSRAPLDLWFVRFCRLRGAKLVLTVHDLLPHDTGQQFKQLYHALYAQMDGLICHSAHIRNRLVQEFGVPEAKIAIIPHGPFFYDLPSQATPSTLHRLGVGTDQAMVLWQGIIFPYKGVDLLLSAWKQVEARTDAVTLVVLGTGDPALLASLKQQAVDLGLRRVRFHFQFCSAQELVEAYAAADVVVYPYRAITTNGALATGLSLNKAIVAGSLPVFQELLTSGENALLVDPADPEQLAAALVDLATDTQLREKLTTAVRAMKFGEHSWQDIAEATARVYERVTSSDS